ncbi:hypothetical protein N9M89_02750 [Amylibacter sp.]|nr:hypothetical protein [Amylibacter sp.]
MIWRKLGLIFEPPQGIWWMESHAQVPFTVEIDDFIRVFFSTRTAQDENGQFVSYSGFVDIDPKDNWKVKGISKKPILELGVTGEFDEFGIMAGSTIEFNGSIFLYYCGWQRLKSVPYNWAIGAATTNDYTSFEKLSNAPIIGPRLNEPYLHACPIVYNVNDELVMFLLTGDRWIKDSTGKLESVYTLKQAKSKNGIDWSAASDAILPAQTKDECQTSCSIFDYNGKQTMVFSYRSGLGFRSNRDAAYKIGFATLDDAGQWNRNDNAISFISEYDDSWDDLMMAYPHVFSYEEKYYMLYCGDEFGKHGFGIAELVE